MKNPTLAILTWLLLVAGSQQLSAQGVAGGLLSGRVLDTKSHAPLPGATVIVQGTRLAATTDDSGRFRLPRVPPGPQTIEASYLGYRTATQMIEVAGATEAPDFLLTLATAVSEAVTVRAEPLLEGQAKALNQQKTAPNIVNVVASDQIGTFPDANAADAAQRIPGVSIVRDNGEGVDKVIRGTEPRLNAVLINGERVMSPVSDQRAVPLDVVQSNLLSTIEVTKALTPDMDGDAIGGTINLVTKTAATRPIHSFEAGYNYARITGDSGAEGALTLGHRFFGDSLGIVLFGTSQRYSRGLQDVELDYTGVGGLDDLQLRDYAITRERNGFGGTIDFNPTPNSSIVVRGVANYYIDDQFRRRETDDVSGGAIDRQLKDGGIHQHINSFSGDGNTLLPNGLLLDYRIAYAYSHNDNKAWNTDFVQDGVTFAPNFSAGQHVPVDNIQANPQNANTSLFLLDGIENSRTVSHGDDFVGAINSTVFLPAGAPFSGEIKFGVKYRQNHEVSANSDVVYSSGNDFALADFLGGSFSSSSPWYSGRYQFGGFPTTNVAGRLLGDPGFSGEADPTAAAGDYDAQERIYAGYGQAELHPSEKLSLLGGLRYENTKNHYRANIVQLDDQGDFSSITPATGSKSYGLVLPSLHLVYAFDRSTNLRAAVTRSFARANFIDLAPTQFVDPSGPSIQLGNPALRPQTAWNFDLLGEKYLSTVGIVSGGIFYKSLRDYIFNFRFVPTTGPYAGFDGSQPQNGRDAHLYGFEAAFQNRFSSLPTPWDGLGFYANYTYVHSRAEFPDRGGAKSTLPGQAKNVANIAVSYEKFGFSGRVALNYIGKFIFAVGDGPGQDDILDQQTHLDVYLSQQISNSLRIFVQLNNLTNAHFRHFLGDSGHPIQDEFYKWWATTGLKLDL